MHFADVSFHDNAQAIQAKTIMAAGDFPKRFASPIFGRQFESCFRFAKGKDESLSVDASCCNKCTLAAVVLESVNKNFAERLLQKLRIDVQHGVACFNLPGNLGTLVRELVPDFLAQILDQIGGSIGDQIGFNFGYSSGKVL